MEFIKLWLLIIFMIALIIGAIVGFYFLIKYTALVAVLVLFLATTFSIAMCIYKDKDEGI